jgi:hypothetical protein
MNELRYRDHRVTDGKHGMKAPYQITLASFHFIFSRRFPLFWHVTLNFVII